MAAIDYGTLVFHNGKQINHDRIMSLHDIGIIEEYAYDYSGWNDAGYRFHMEDNHTGFAGDEEFYLAFYKDIIRFVCNGNITRYIDDWIWVDRLGVEKISKSFRPMEFNISGAHISVRSYAGEGERFFVRIRYKGNTWHIISGYGIDVKRRVFERTWREYGITRREYNLIHRMWKESDRLTEKKGTYHV